MWCLLAYCSVTVRRRKWHSTCVGASVNIQMNKEDAAEQIADRLVYYTRRAPFTCAIS